MKSLADLLNFVVSTLQASPLCHAVSILETLQFSDEQFALKVRAELANGNTLQVRLYYNRAHIDYAYQIFRKETPMIRWDNKEHFPSIATQPHHFHMSADAIESSPLDGDPQHDLPIILNYLTTLKAD